MKRVSESLKKVISKQDPNTVKRMQINYYLSLPLASFFFASSQFFGVGGEVFEGVDWKPCQTCFLVNEIQSRIQGSRLQSCVTLFFLFFFFRFWTFVSWEKFSKYKLIAPQNLGYQMPKFPFPCTWFSKSQVRRLQSWCGFCHVHFGVSRKRRGRGVVAEGSLKMCFHPTQLPREREAKAEGMGFRFKVLRLKRI